MIVIGDLSPLTALARTGRLELLRQLHREVIVPAGLRDEFVRAHPRLPWFFEVKSVVNHSYVADLRRWLDEQEAEAIALSKELNADVLLMDEHLGRRLARREGVRLLGLMGLLVAAKRHGHIFSVREVFTEVKAVCGFRIAAGVETAVYSHVGE
jgi:predicted nucleic acid-binding protein